MQRVLGRQAEYSLATTRPGDRVFFPLFYSKKRILVVSKFDIFKAISMSDVCFKIDVFQKQTLPFLYFTSIKHKTSWLHVCTCSCVENILRFVPWNRAH